MSANTVALVVALAGLVTGIVTTFMSQHSAAKARREDAHRATLADAARRRAEAQDRNIAELKAAYTDLNATSRKFVTSMNGFLIEIEREGPASREMLAGLVLAKSEHRYSYSQFQMIARDYVLRSASATNQVLNETFGRVRRLEQRLARDAASALPEISEMIGQRGVLSDQVHIQRSVLRHDLGVSDQAEPTPI